MNRLAASVLRRYGLIPGWAPPTPRNRGDVVSLVARESSPAATLRCRYASRPPGLSPNPAAVLSWRELPPWPRNERGVGSSGLQQIPKSVMRDLVETLRTTRTIKAGVAVLTEMGKCVGLPIIAVIEDLSRSSVILDEDDRPITEPFDWPEGFIEHWIESNYTLLHPVAQRCRIEVLPFHWSPEVVLRVDPPQSARQQKVLKESAGAGIVSAITVPVHLPRAQVASVAFLGRSIQPTGELVARWGPEMLAAAYHFMAIVLKRAGDDVLPRDMASLSPREIECLTWAARGKTDVEIGTICQLSPSTARSYIDSAAHKLNATTRTQAVAIACQLGMIGRAR